jgi:hypothetical protein
VGTGSREENASKQESRALIPSEPQKLYSRCPESADKDRIEKTEIVQIQKSPGEAGAFCLMSLVDQ